ncbi:hypothetical protein [Arthrobacter sp. CAN_C5]|uniref:hypothetical protein n=1 Tax=Arthrobacter sp. CAN_C5 TaxID=2760706 RepID=UPI001AE3F426|nr:hypothetical protein [Arthrobacter sp. CAN_C5]MBP2215968.1 hypothetical protein [Arthrobacter sp. CAN_C5]
MKKVIGPLTLTAALALTGCGGAENSATPASNGDTAVEEAPEDFDLTGTWTQSNSNSEDSYQQATITDDTISIDWVSDGGDTTAIYWIGTFEEPADAEETFAWTSIRDAEATDMAILAATSDDKEFTYEGDTITYEVSALGTTTKVALRGSW